MTDFLLLPSGEKVGMRGTVLKAPLPYSSPHGERTKRFTLQAARSLTLRKNNETRNHLEWHSYSSYSQYSSRSFWAAGAAAGTTAARARQPCRRPRSRQGTSIPAPAWTGQSSAGAIIQAASSATAQAQAGSPPLRSQGSRQRRRYHPAGCTPAPFSRTARSYAGDPARAVSSEMARIPVRLRRSLSQALQMQAPFPPEALIPAPLLPTAPYSAGAGTYSASSAMAQTRTQVRLSPSPASRLPQPLQRAAAIPARGYLTEARAAGALMRLISSAIPASSQGQAQAR